MGDLKKLFPVWLEMSLESRVSWLNKHRKQICGERCPICYNNKTLELGELASKKSICLSSEVKEAPASIPK